MTACQSRKAARPTWALLSLWLLFKRRLRHRGCGLISYKKMAIPAQLLNNLNKDFAVMVTQVTNHQAEFIASNPGYWQGILNPPTIPADGNSETIVLTLSPTDQPFDWSWIVGHLPSTSIFSVEVDVHHGPLGKAFTLRGWVSITG